MANICTNEMHICSDDPKNITVIISFLDKYFPTNEIGEAYDNVVEVTFDSKWDFPEKKMNYLYQKIPNKKDILIDCLSVEWGNRYCQFSYCDKDGWHFV